MDLVVNLPKMINFIIPQLLLILVLFSNVLKAQCSFNIDTTLQFQSHEIPDPSGMHRNIARELQPVRKYENKVGERYILNSSMKVYEQGLLTPKPFARIRYDMHLQENNGMIIFSIRNFTFKEIRRDRYGRHTEKGGKPIPLIQKIDDINDKRLNIICEEILLMIEESADLLQKYDSKISYLDSSATR